VPEGDTVLRTARRLDQALSGRPLVRAELRWPTLGDVDLAGRTVLETRSYGKQILTRLAADTGTGPGVRIPTASAEPLTLRSHLRMEGRWEITRPGPARWPRAGGVTVRAVLGTDAWTAVGTWLGLLDLIPTRDEHTLLGHLGPDILAPDPDGAALARAAQRIAARPDRTVGAALLDQTGVAGIGTMYMAETLFLQQLSPWTPVAEVELPAILARARRLLEHGASSATPSTTGSSRRGEQNYVHARSGRPCRRCGTMIRVAPVGVAPRERPAFWCPVCQPGPAPADDGRVHGPLGSNPAVGAKRRPAGYRKR